jgi:hypothetical protein
MKLISIAGSSASNNTNQSSGGLTSKRVGGIVGGILGLALLVTVLIIL